MSALNSTIGFSSIKSATNCRKFLAEPAVLDPAEVMNARCLIGGRGGRGARRQTEFLPGYLSVFLSSQEAIDSFDNG